MNVTIDAMQGARVGRVLWWFTLIAVTVGGLVMRLLTIDRNTQGIGTFVYVGMLCVMFLIIALPIGIGGAFFWHATARYRWLAWCRRFGGDQRARWYLVMCAVIVSLLFASAGRRLPEWHVWLGAAAWNALLVWRLFELMLRELREDAQREANHV